jgi:hypothetical protein
MPIRRGVSKGVEDGRPQATQFVGGPSQVTCPHGVEWSGMAAPGKL